MTLHDFEITGPMDVRGCGNAGGFRAVRRRDQLPVLLHRFRPAAHYPAWAPTGPAAIFETPFVTSFAGCFHAAGTAYLVEPLPECVPLLDAWHTVLRDGPADAAGFVLAFLIQAYWLLHTLTLPEVTNAAVCADNIVLTPAGTYGMLCSVVHWPNSGRYPSVLRPAPRSRHDVVSDDNQKSHPLVRIQLFRIVEELLDAEVQMAAASSTPILTPEIRARIWSLVEENQDRTARPVNQ